MRVTVIATGIGSGPDTSSANKVTDHPLRGVVRDITPEDLDRGIDLDEPTFIRIKEPAQEAGLMGYNPPEGMIIDNSDLEVPTFLRRKAD
jgi:cell division protein FtsZ